MTDQEKENLTINVRNEEIEEFIDTYLKENTPQHLNKQGAYPCKAEK